MSVDDMCVCVYDMYVCACVYVGGVCEYMCESMCEYLYTYECESMCGMFMFYKHPKINEVWKTQRVLILVVPKFSQSDVFLSCCLVSAGKGVGRRAGVQSHVQGLQIGSPCPAYHWC